MTRFLENLNECTDPTSGDMLRIYDASAASNDKDRRVDVAKFALLGSQLFKIGTYTNGDTTPSVANCNVLIITNSSPTTITNLDDGYSGQIVILYFNDGNTTISAFLYGPTLPYTPTQYDTLVLINIGGSWIHIARSAN